MNLEITGTICHIYDTQQVTETFKKREFIVEVAGEYPQQLMLQVIKDKCDLLDKHQLNEEVKVKVNVKGRKVEKDGKVYCFNTLEAWKIESLATDPSF